MTKRRTAPAADPIFAAIEAHRAAEKQANSMPNVSGADGGRATKALRRLLATPPTTLAGIRAVLEYLGEPAQIENLQVETCDGNPFLTLARSPVLADGETEGRAA